MPIWCGVDQPAGRTGVLAADAGQAERRERCEGQALPAPMSTIGIATPVASTRRVSDPTSRSGWKTPATPATSLLGDEPLGLAG